MRHLLLAPLLLLTFPYAAAAQGNTGVTRLTNIPFVDEGASIGELVFGLFLLAITLAAVFAVVKLVIAGIKYIVTDITSTKESAKSDIKGAILGLLLILSTILIVDLINPEIANTNISLSPVNLTVPEPPTRPSAFEQTCTTIGGGENMACEEITCDSIERMSDTQVANWIGSHLAWGLDLVSTPTRWMLNQATCVARCGIAAGQISSDGNCVYASDPEAARENVRERTMQELSANVEEYFAGLENIDMGEELDYDTALDCSGNGQFCSFCATETSCTNVVNSCQNTWMPDLQRSAQILAINPVQMPNNPEGGSFPPATFLVTCELPN